VLDDVASTAAPGRTSGSISRRGSDGNGAEGGEDDADGSASEHHATHAAPYAGAAAAARLRGSTHRGPTVGAFRSVDAPSCRAWQVLPST
jgi:hypothetical protein